MVDILGNNGTLKMKSYKDLYDIQCERNQRLLLQLNEIKKRMRTAESCLRLLQKVKIKN